MSIPLLVSLGYDKTFVPALAATAGGLVICFIYLLTGAWKRAKVVHPAAAEE